MFKAIVAPLTFVLVSALVITGLVVGAIKYTSLLSDDAKACTARWESEIDFGFARQVREDLAKAKEARCEILKVALMSPGGSVIQTFEATRAILAARDEGLVVEIHGQTLVASGATFILAAGSPSHRFLDKNALYLIHGARRQSSPFEEPKCLTILPEPQTEDDRVTNEVLKIMGEWYARLSGKSYKEASSWLACGKDAIGPSVAVKRGLADHLE
jgi:hypothetical protein